MIQRLSDKRKPCTYCTQYGHTAFKCPRKPRSTLTTHSTLQARKPIRQVGKQGQKTASYVAQWKAKTPANHQGYWTCYISGHQIPYLMAEHPYSKARHPDMRTNQKLEPVCSGCNELKGSLDIADFLKKYPQYKTTVKQEYL